MRQLPSAGCSPDRHVYSAARLLHNQIIYFVQLHTNISSLKEAILPQIISTDLIHAFAMVNVRS